MVFSNLTAIHSQIRTRCGCRRGLRWWRNNYRELQGKKDNYQNPPFLGRFKGACAIYFSPSLFQWLTESLRRISHHSKGSLEVVMDLVHVCRDVWRRSWWTKKCHACGQKHLHIASQIKVWVGGGKLLRANCLCKAKLTVTSTALYTAFTTTKSDHYISPLIIPLRVLATLYTNWPLKPAALWALFPLTT